MLYKFRKIVEKYKLWDVDDSLLVAVSGGLDSMVLLNLCRQLYNPIAVVHCNFNLRGKDSDADETLVRDFAKKYDLELHCASFDTKSYAMQNNISIEMAARDLRYAYFEQLCQKYHYTKILTAHHANDNAETLLLNLSKGTGIRGFTGIPRKRNKIVRPLLSFTREDLQKYAAQEKLSYREDKTNNEFVYQRNKIRHKIIPSLEEINPSVVQTLNANCERMQEVRAIYEDYVKIKLHQLVKENTVLIEQLIKEEYSQSLLFEWLSPYGFSATVVENILKDLAATEEKQFFATSHRLVKSRGKLLLVDLWKKKFSEYSITKKGIKTPIKLDIQDFNGVIFKNKNIAYFDADTLKFPLLLRKWKEGDRFVPFGMRGSKKVSELFKDKKLTTLEKESIWVLCSEEAIIWVVGIRADEQHKIKETTERGIQITFEQ